MNKIYNNPEAYKWFKYITDNPEYFPFSFVYDGEVFEGFSQKDFTICRSTQLTEEGKETVELVLKKSDALIITIKCSYYVQYGVTEWTVWFENPSGQNSAIIENPQSKLVFEGELPVLKGILGDHVNYYRPYNVDLSSMPVCFESNSGRATHVNFPYFNLEYGDGGSMLAIGWAGTWKADFRFDGVKTVYTARSVNGLRTYLKPGEKIRTALFVKADYTVREENYATNYWRKWFVEHNLPAADQSGKKTQPFSTCCLACDTGLPNSDGSISERYSTWRPSFEKMIEQDVKVDFRWFDAGWYVAPDGSSPETDWWGTIGTWQLDPVKWPGDTFRQSTDFAREHGMKTLMWFEPERVTNPEALAENYGYQSEWAIKREGIKAIANNIGDPECLNWTLNRMKTTLLENKVEMYREDNNSDPAELWKYLDAVEGIGRTGITECKFINAHYYMWDEIIACTMSYGGCGFVDSCASGGGRNDLESMRRGIPLLRSDHDRTSVAVRLSMTTSFNKWIPFCGASSKEKKGELDAEGKSDVYIWRASYLPVLNVSSRFVQEPDQDFSVLRFGLTEWKKVNSYLLKDFYTLTPWHSEYEKTGFTAYSFYDEDTKKGILLVFRQEGCEEDLINVTLPYVGQEDICMLKDEDNGSIIQVSGKEMREKGVALTCSEKRMARLIWVSVESGAC